MVYAIIMAGGMGTRMGAAVPKQFLMLEGKPVLAHTIDRFIRSSETDEIVVMCPESEDAAARKLIAERFPNETRIHLVHGGASRGETLLLGIDFIKKNFAVDADTIILTHDGVRPIVSQRIIHDNIVCAAKYGACNTAVAVTDTLTVSRSGEFAEETPDRSIYYRCQTPQSFTLGCFEKAIEGRSRKELAGMTDACSIFTRAGLRVKLVEGDEHNIKITKPGDIETAGLFIRSE